MTESTHGQQTVMVPAVAGTGMVTIRAVPSAHQQSTTIVGLPDEHAWTTHYNIRAAVAASNLAWPQQPITLTVLPRSLPVGDAGLDLAFAVAVLAASGQIPTRRLATTIYLGELGMDGGLRTVRDVATRLAVVAHADFPDAVVPAGNLAEATLSTRSTVHGARTLAGLVAGLRGEAPLLSPVAWPTAPERPDADLADLPAEYGPERRILEIAAAGGHHLLMSGHLAGAVALAERLPGLLPDLDRATAAQVAQVHRRAGTLPDGAAVRRRPPWQAPHHSVSLAGLAGTPGRPGALGLAHGGVLFCNHADRLTSPARGALRQALERRRVITTGDAASNSDPAHVQLLLATTGYPSPGGDQRGCPPDVHRRLRGRMSTLLDRVDIHATLPPMPPSTDQPGESSAAVAARVASARAAAEARWAHYRWRSNSEATSDALHAPPFRIPAARLTPLRDHIAAGSLSAGGAVQVLRLAWTIADLAGHIVPTAEDLAEALRLRIG